MTSGFQPVLLLHGQPGAARDWDRVVRALGAAAAAGGAGAGGSAAAAGGAVAAIAVDRPGWNNHGAAVGLRANAEAAIAVLDDHSLESATVVGHSFGAAVAAWLAVQWPERVSALVLVSPSANVASLYRFDRWLAARGAGYLASAVALELVGLALGARRTRRTIAAELKLEESYLESAGRVLRGPAAWRSFVIEQRALIEELPALERRLPEISAPTTVVVGSRDIVVPRGSAQRLTAQIPKARLIVLEQSGHLLPLQQAERLAELILAAEVR